MDLLPCCQHATSVAGLSTLQRQFPRSWHKILRACFPEEIAPGATVRGYLEDGAGGLLQPKRASDGSIKKKRAGARHIAEELGDLVIEHLTERDLRDARRRYLAAPLGGRSPALRSADLRVFRQAVYLGRKALGIAPVARTWTRRRPAPGRGGRRQRTPTPAEVRSLLRVAPRLVLGAVAFIVGCGLLTGEVLALRAGDVLLADGLVLVRHEHLRGKPGVSTEHFRRLPPWALQLVQRAWPRLARMRPDALLFPGRREPEKPWTGLTRGIRAAAIAAGLCLPKDDDDRWTPTGLRRLYQLVARLNGVPRGLVRGTVPTVPPEHQALAIRYWIAASDRVARKWVYLLRPPNYPAQGARHVPKRAPAGVRVDQPEYPNLRTQRWVAARKVAQDLPPGCDDVPTHIARSEARKTPATMAPTPTLAEAGVPGHEPPAAPMPAPQEVVSVPAPATKAEILDAIEAGTLGGFTIGTLLGLNLPREKGEPDGEGGEDPPT
ncbi:MAG: site-specific integrase [Pseudomonadota bacterium]